jgi:hypothetical protein
VENVVRRVLDQLVGGGRDVNVSPISDYCVLIFPGRTVIYRVNDVHVCGIGDIHKLASISTRRDEGIVAEEEQLSAPCIATADEGRAGRIGYVYGHYAAARHIGDIAAQDDIANRANAREVQNAYCLRIGLIGNVRHSEREVIGCWNRPVVVVAEEQITASGSDATGAFVKLHPGHFSGS